MIRRCPDAPSAPSSSGGRTSWLAPSWSSIAWPSVEFEPSPHRGRGRRRQDPVRRGSSPVEASERGFRILQGGCVAIGGMGLPFAPIASALRDDLDSDDREALLDLDPQVLRRAGRPRPGPCRDRRPRPR